MKLASLSRALPMASLALSPGIAWAERHHPVPMATPRFEITFPAAAHPGPITGRLVLVLAKTAQPEPRLAISPRGPALFAIDVDQWSPGRAVVIDEAALGYPMALSALPPGDYFVQAVINVYEQVHRADGKTVWLPMNDGNIEFFSNAAHNLYSDVVPVHVGGDGAEANAFKVDVTHVLPAFTRPKDTEWIKQVTFQSPMLTKFWGRPIFMHASVLLPKGYAEHPATHYPTVYTLGHGESPLSFSTNPPRSGLAGRRQSGDRHSRAAMRRIQAWNADDYPRVIAISLEQQTPYFPDSYSVNSANNGPYGDAIVEESDSVSREDTSV